MYPIVTMKKIANSAMKSPLRPGALAFYYDSSAGIANENEQRGTPVCRLLVSTDQGGGKRRGFTAAGMASHPDHVNENIATTMKIRA
jgi:hypothetical protein